MWVAGVLPGLSRLRGTVGRCGAGSARSAGALPVSRTEYDWWLAGRRGLDTGGVVGRAALSLLQNPKVMRL